MAASDRLECQLCELVRSSVAGQRNRPPEAGLLYWSIFRDLHEDRRIGQHAPDPIQYSEIKAYADLMQWPLRPQDVEIIRAMDRAYIETYNNEAPTAPTVSKQALTPAIFDAVFS